MTFVRSLFIEALGLFVEDGSLAVQLILLIGVVTALIKLMAVPPLIGATILLVGCMVILAVSIYRETTKRR